MANLDTATINKAFEGPKKKEKAVMKVERPDGDIESWYEEWAECNAAKDDGREAMAVDEGDDVDALPVKSLTGELRYLSAPKKSSDGNAVLEARKAKANGTSVVETPSESVETPPTDTTREKKVKLTKQERKKLKKEERKKDIEEQKKADESAADGGADQDRKEGVSYISVQQRRVELKAHMAELGMGLLSSPEANLGSLEDLQEMCEDRDDSVARWIARWRSSPRWLFSRIFYLVIAYGCLRRRSYRWLCPRKFGSYETLKLLFSSIIRNMFKL